MFLDAKMAGCHTANNALHTYSECEASHRQSADTSQQQPTAAITRLRQPPSETMHSAHGVDSMMGAAVEAQEPASSEGALSEGLGCCFSIGSLAKI